MIKKNCYILLLMIFILCGCAKKEVVVNDQLSLIKEKDVLIVGVKVDTPPFGFVDKNNKNTGFDVELAKIIAEKILGDSKKLIFVPVNTSNRIMKLTSAEVDMVIATVTITPQREEIIDFSIPYDYAGQALLVRADSSISSIADLAGKNVGVVYGTTAEKNMLALAPNSTIIGFRNYHVAYEALKAGKIDALTSDDTILSTFTFDDKSVKLLPKRYSKEPYGIALKQGESTQRLREAVDFAITDMKVKNVILRLRKKWKL